ncbi:MAG TPA: tetratricopeptide repeat protein, partial [Oscillatoriaceae cyanobacterium]
MSASASKQQSLARRALAHASAGRMEAALEVLGDACGMEGGHRAAFEPLIAQAQEDGQLPLAERMMLDYARQSRSRAVHADLAALFRANARWEYLKELDTPLSPAQIRAIALRRFEAGEYGMARKLLRSYLERAEADSEVLRLLGLLAEDSHELAQAEACYRHAQALEKPPGSATLELGTFYWRHGRDAEARRWLEAALKTTPGDLHVAGLLASTRAALGEVATLPTLF